MLRIEKVHKRKTSDAEIDQIIAMHIDGKSPRVISCAIGLCISVAYYWIRLHDAGISRSHLANAQIEQVRELRASGLVYKDIMDKTGFAISTIHAHCLGVKMHAQRERRQDEEE